MKRYDQLLLPDPPRLFGDSFATCLRCILEIDGTIPNFGMRDDWSERAQRWLSDLGLAYIQLQIPPGNYQWKSIGFHLLGGQSPAGYPHWVVGLKGNVFWDPHPSRAGLIGALDIWNVGLLVMLGRAPKGEPVPSNLIWV